MLVADDDSDIRALLVWMFMREGHRVTAVADGMEALRELETGRYNVAVLDDNLSGMAGGQVLQTLHDRGFSRPPVLMVCSVASGPDRGEARPVEADVHVHKPFTSVQLLTAVASLLEG